MTHQFLQLLLQFDVSLSLFIFFILFQNARWFCVKCKRVFAFYFLFEWQRERHGGRKPRVPLSKWRARSRRPQSQQTIEKVVKLVELLFFLLSPFILKPHFFLCFLCWCCSLQGCRFTHWWKPSFVVSSYPLPWKGAIHFWCSGVVSFVALVFGGFVFVVEAYRGPFL